MLRSIRLASALLASIAACGVVRPLHAAPCSGLENPLYGAGGSAITPTFKKIAPELLKLSPKITLVFKDPSACQGYDEFASGTIKGVAHYWDANGVQNDCELPLAGAPAAFGTMGNSVALCPGRTLPADVGDFEGPIQTVNIIAPRASNQTTISAEALHYIFGLGETANVSPWNDEAFLVRRKPGSFVHSFIAQAASVPAESFKGDVEVSTNGDTITQVAALGASNPNATLGYVSGPNAEAASATIRTLAYQHSGQTCGYWPNSTEDARDKLNVRSGQYYLWAPNHFFAHVDPTTKEIVDPAVRKLVAYLSGADTPPAEVHLNEQLIAAGNVPQCAMRVKRAGDLGAISSWAPPVPCACTFEKIATGATSCTPCSGDGECASSGGKCRNNYCEAY